MSHISRVFTSEIFSENKMRKSRIRGKSSALEDCGNENPVRCNGSHDRRLPMENATFCGQDLVEMDFSVVATFGNASFLVLCHFWTNLSSDVTASRWNVDHLFLCVRPYHNVTWL